MKRAFVGLSTPLTYDYFNYVDDGEHEPFMVPNAVLENVTGLLLCYDEIWFVSREFCPIDMQNLPYVKFVTDFPDLLERALTAKEQYSQDGMMSIAATLGENRPGDYFEIIERVKSSLQFEFRPDNHSRGITPGFGQGNSADPYLFVQDLGIAAALDMSVDVVTNSTMALALSAFQSQGPAAESFQQWQIHAAEEVIAMRTIDHLGPKGAYHESLDELRIHPRLNEFRHYLSEADEAESDAVSLAREINRLADTHAVKVMDRYVKGRGRLATIGRASIGPIGNVLHPGLGSLLSGAISLGEWKKEAKNRKDVAWALFVLQARSITPRLT